ncbi:MAG: hypothetical protein EPN48_09295 [Microbacteriaceae bacterium]|nr:MAG: hypothetical protein EPN48_09295 [Microbacteriaceae bacterium]
MSEERFTIVAASGDLLIGALPVAKGRVSSRRILKAAGARIVRLTLDAGQILTEHTAAVPILIHVLAGEVRIDTDGTTLDLPAGAVLHLDAQLPHSVEALTPAHLTLTLLDGHDAVRLGHGRGTAHGTTHTQPPAVTPTGAPATGAVGASSAATRTSASPSASVAALMTSSSLTNMLVFATSGADSAALTAITRQHSELSGTLAANAVRLLEAAASDDPDAWRGARANLVTWCRESLALQLAAEADALYAAAEGTPAGDDVVRRLRAGIEHIDELIERVASVDEAADLAAATISLRVAVARHLSTESERLLPLLAGSCTHSLASLWNEPFPRLDAVPSAR